MYINIKENFQTKAYAHHEYHINNSETHDSSFLLPDIDPDKLPKQWEVVKTFMYDLPDVALSDAMLEIDLDLSRFGIFVNAKGLSVEHLSDIVGVNLASEYNLYIDENTIYIGFFFDGNTGNLLYIRKAVNILKADEKNYSKGQFEKELQKLCDKFSISEIPTLPFYQTARPNFYTFELHKGGECRKLQFEVFVKGMYHDCGLYFDGNTIDFLTKIKQELDYPCINHYKIDFIYDNWQMIKIYLYGLSKECEFLKAKDFTEYKPAMIINTDEMLESLNDKLKRIMF